MQTVPEAQLRHRQQEKNFFHLFSPFYLLSGSAVSFLYGISHRINIKTKKILFEKKARGAKEKGLFLA